MYYIFRKTNKVLGFNAFGKQFGTWLLIFTNFVPISLMVTLEAIKYCQGKFISWDIEIYDKKTQTRAIVQTSTLNEELGQIKVSFLIVYRSFVI